MRLELPLFGPKKPVPNQNSRRCRKTPAALAPGKTVEEHCRIAGAVAENLPNRLFAIWPAGAAIFPVNSSLAALLHDIGKISPKFQKMLYEHLQMLAAWPQLAQTADRTNDNSERHEAIS